MRPIRTLFSALFIAPFVPLLAQYAPPDPSGFQGIIVEHYYVADSADAADEDGSTGLVPGAVTYRVFVDLKPGYKLLTVGGFTNHPITFSTTTSFFNNDDRGEAWGDHIGSTHLDENTVALDSWLAAGAASNENWAVLKSSDTDGSIVGGVNNDGGSNGVSGGLLVNAIPLVGIPLTTSDGLLDSVPPVAVYVGDPPAMFDAGTENSYSNDNFAWAVLGGIAGPDTSNRILIGQFTTDGEFQFCLNITVRIPDSLVCNNPNCQEIMEFYADLLESDTAGTSYDGDSRFTDPTLCFNSTVEELDCEGVPGGSALPGTPCDDGDPNTSNETWQPGCLCSGSVGLDEHDAQFTVSTRPNPARDLVWIEIATANAGVATMELRDAVGGLVMSRALGTIAGQRLETLDLSKLNSGIYFLRITVNGRDHVERITHF